MTLLRRASRWMGNKGVEEPRLDAEVLLAFAWGSDRAGLYRRLYEVPPRAVYGRFLDLVRRRRRRAPVAYLTGTRDFGEVTLRVGPGVLVPRPETELLVECVADWLGTARPAERSASAARDPLGHGAPRARVLDVGCGSGNIPISIARAVEGVLIVGADVSAVALEYTLANCIACGVQDRIPLVRFDVFGSRDAVRPGTLDVIVSNPPYVERPDEGFSGELAHEPDLALCGHSGPFPAIYEALAVLAERALVEDGMIAVEVGAGQANVVAALFARRFRHVERRLDLAGIERVVIATGKVGPEVSLQ